MSLSIAKLRESKHVGLPERTYELCLAQALVAKAQRLDNERDGILAAEQAEIEAGRPKRAADKANPRLAEIKAELAALLGEMSEHTGELRLRGVDAGAWRRWADAHPAREVGRDDKGRPIVNKVDSEVAYGLVDATALLGDLESYAVAWNDEPLGPGDWEFIASKAAPGDLNELCKIVVQMHETTGYRAPKSHKTSSETTPDESVSPSPAA